jgi:hypothetical protein
LRAKLEELEEELREQPGPRRKLKLKRRYARLRARVKAAFTTMGLSRHVREAVIAEMRHQLEQFRQAHQIVQHYEEATGRSKNQLLREAAEAEDRRHVLKVNGTRENLLDIAARIREAQRTMKAVERRVKASVPRCPGETPLTAATGRSIPDAAHLFIEGAKSIQVARQAVVRSARATRSPGTSCAKPGARATSRASWNASSVDTRRSLQQDPSLTVVAY